ncbi:MAG: hypothetical protein WB615_02930 [Candidatus Tumulicola sp.]
MMPLLAVGGVVALALVVVGIVALDAPHRMAHAYGCRSRAMPAPVFTMAPFAIGW